MSGDRAEYQRQYRAANRDKLSAYGRRYRAANRGKIEERERRYKAANRDKANEQRRRHHAANRDKINEQKRRHSAANRDRINERQRRYRAANRGKINERRRRYSHGLWPDEWQALWDAQDGKCYLCGDPLPDNPSEARLDHDHRCCPPGRSCPRCQRGLAHDACNVLIGLAGDDPARLRLIARNLERARRRVDRRPAAQLDLFSVPGPSEPRQPAASPNGARRRQAPAPPAPLTLFDLPPSANGQATARLPGRLTPTGRIDDHHDIQPS